MKPLRKCIAQDLTIALDQYGDASITVEDINSGSSDACWLQLLTVSPCFFLL